MACLGPVSSFWSSSSNFLASSAQKAQKENGDRTFLALLSKQTESSPNYCDNSVRWRGGSQDRMSEAKGKANGTCVSTKQTGPLRKSSTSPACAGAPERKEEPETEQLDGAGHHSGDEKCHKKGWFCVCVFTARPSQFEAKIKCLVSMVSAKPQSTRSGQSVTQSCRSARGRGSRLCTPSPLPKGARRPPASRSRLGLVDGLLLRRHS